MNYSLNRRRALFRARVILVWASGIIAAFVPSYASAQQADPFAADSKNFDSVLSTYLNAGGNPNARDGHESLLERAETTSDLVAVKMLLDHGAEPNLNAPATLEYLLSQAQTEIVTQLINHGSNFSRPAGEKTLVGVAIEADRSDIALLLLSHGSPLANDDAGILFRAVQAGSAQLIRYLLSHGFSPDTSDAHGPAIGQIGKTNELNMLQAFVDAHADVNAGHGIALQHACENKDTAAVLLLLANGANPNIQMGPHTPLVTSAVQGDSDSVRALLGAHADPNVADTNGNTALILSAWQADPLTVKYLLTNGAKVDATNKDGATALIQAADGGSVEIVKLLLDAKANPNLADSDGDTALLDASEVGHELITGLLLRTGANVHVTDKAGMTPLIGASIDGSPGAVSDLLTAGADRGGKFQGKTAQDWAKQLGNNDAVGVLKSGVSSESFPKEFTLAEMGAPLRQVRRETLDSLMFRDTFLLSANDVTKQPLGLSEAQKAELSRQLQALLDAARSMLQLRGRDIQKTLGVNLLDTSGTKILLEDSGSPEAYTIQSTASPAGTIVIDAKLLSANLEASLRSLIKGTDPATPAQELAEISETRRQIENLGSESFVNVSSTTVGHMNIDPSQIGEIGKVFDLLNYAQSIKPVSVQYYGTLLFVIAHELGHVALGHGINPVACPKRELDADSFAAYLLSEPVMGMSIQGIGIGSFLPTGMVQQNSVALMLDDDELKSYTGYFLFFGKSYEIAKFGASDQSCIYPDPAERTLVIESAIKVVRDANEDKMIKKLARRRDIRAFLNSGIVARMAILKSLN